MRVWPLLTLVACEPFRVLDGGDVVVIDGEDRIGVNIDRVDFGTVSATAAMPGEELVRVSNLGDTEVAVYVDGTALNDTPFFLLSDARIFSLGVGESVDFPVYFAPTTESEVDAELVLEPGDVHVQLHAKSTAPVATVTPLEIGNVVVGCTADRPMLVTNTGSEPLELDGVNSNSEGFSAEAEITTLAAGASTEVMVSFTPTAGQAYAGEVLLLTNDPERPRLSVAVSGTGDDGEKAVEEFQYALGDPTDVLLLVDNGASMAPYLDRGASAVGMLIEALRDSNTDYHLAALGLDGECPKGNLAFATSKDSVGTAEAMAKAPFEAMDSPVDDDLLPLAVFAMEGGEDDCLAGFRREDAALHIIGITDGPAESDFSANLAAVDEFVLPPFELTLSVFTPAETCGAHAWDWTDAARDSDGAVYDACALSWEAAMQGVAGVTSRIDDVSFYLSGRPIPTTIDVLVEGVSATTWSYDDETNAVVFPSDARPPRGANIEVHYVDHAACDLE